eukprot:gene33410-18404_t
MSAIPREDVQRVFEKGAQRRGDGSRYIHRTEVITRLQQLGLSVEPRKLGEVMDEMDLNRDGVIDFDEFWHYYQSTAPESNLDDEAIREMFRIFDADDSGYLDREEFRTMMRESRGARRLRCPAASRFPAIDPRGEDGLTDAEIDDLFAQADSAGNSDGRVDLDEFVAFILARNA